MSVKVETNEAATVKDPEVGDLFTQTATRDVYQIRELPSGKVSMCGLNGHRWGEAFATIAGLGRSCLASLIPFKPGQSVTITQE